MKVECGWCGLPMGEKPDCTDPRITHPQISTGICDRCLEREFPEEEAA